MSIDVKCELYKIFLFIVKIYADSIWGHENRSYRIFNRESLFLEALLGEKGKEICPVLSWKENTGALVKITAIEIWVSEANRAQKHKSNVDNYRHSNNPISSQSPAITLP